MYCSNCGHNLPDDSQFCTKCGASLIKKASVSQKKKHSIIWGIVIGSMALVTVVLGLIIGLIYLKGKQDLPEKTDLSVEQEAAKEVIKEEKLKDQIVIEEETVEEEIVEEETVDKEIIDNTENTIESLPPEVESPAVPKLEPFYGVWCQASKNKSDMQKYADELKGKGFAAQVFLTSDWSNLNQEPWYAVTAGIYQTEAEAKIALNSVSAICRDAYIKYSGNYQSELSVEYVADGPYMVCIMEMLADGNVTYRYSDTSTEALYPLEGIYKIKYSNDVKITILDPNEEYGPNADSVPATKETFMQMVKDAFARNGFGFTCGITVKDGMISEIDQFYLP